MVEARSIENGEGGEMVVYRIIKTWADVISVREEARGGKRTGGRQVDRSNLQR